MTSRDRFIAEARRWIGVPWLHQGRNRHGVDCVGLLLVTAWALRLSDYNITGYGLFPRAEWMQEEFDRMMPRVEEAQPGDVVLMRLARRLLHVGIRTEHGVIHAWGGRRVVEVRMPWPVAVAYSVPGVR